MGLSALLDIDIMFFIFPNPNSNIVAFLGIW